MDSRLFALTILVLVLGTGIVIVRTAVMARYKNSEPREEVELSVKRIEKSSEDRFEKIEARLANLESLVIEEEKAKKFDAL